jgi:putrescine transport system permease protein
VTLAHASVSVAYVTVVVRARLAGTPADLEDAALDLYAPPWKAFALVTLPLMAPALISGWLLSFTLSLDDVVVASFTSGPGASTLPMVVFSSIKLGPTPELYALASMIVAIVAAILLGVSWAQRGSAAATIAGDRPLR